MSFWQFQAAVFGVHRANNPDEEAAEAPSPDDLMSALQSSVMN